MSRLPTFTVLWSTFGSCCAETERIGPKAQTMVANSVRTRFHFILRIMIVFPISECLDHVGGVNDHLTSGMPGWSAGRGPGADQKNLRSDSRIGTSLMLASRRRTKP